MAQLDLFPKAVAVESPIPTVESVRSRFAALLTPLREATDEIPLSDRELAFWQVVTPQMANWLPEGEREAVCAEFAGHVERLQRRRG